MEMPWTEFEMLVGGLSINSSLANRIYSRRKNGSPGRGGGHGEHLIEDPKQIDSVLRGIFGGGKK